MTVEHPPAAGPVSVPPPGRPSARRWRAIDRAADYGLIWAVLGAGLSSRSGAVRRAGVRAATAAAATSLVVHAVAKPLLPRAHPAAGRFPSAHAASAAAFAVGASMESPTVGALTGPVALAVTVARGRVGARGPTELVAGAAVGAGVALLSRRWWPVRQAVPARARPARDAPALPDGAGLVVVANSAAGSGALTPADDPAGRVHALMPRAQVVDPAPGVDFVAEVEEALDRPSVADGTPPVAVGVAGGDGSVAAMAGLAERRGLPLVVLPAGTLNHFARDVGIPGIDEALTAAHHGRAVLVDVGLVDSGGPHGASRSAFVNTASLGGYPDMVRLREGWEGRFGKWPSAALALIRVLAEAAPLHVEIDERPRTIWVLFVGNGVYHPVGMGPLFRPRLDSRLLDVRYLRADVPFSRTRFVAAVLTGTLHRSRVYVERHVAALDVVVTSAPVGLATDGEVQPDAQVFRFRVGPHPVPVYRPD